MDNRSNILTQALRLFAARGYDGVGIQEIVDAAGITKPTLYHYFGSKEGLLTELMREYGGPFHDRLRQAGQYVQRDLMKTLDQVANAYFNFAQANAEFYRLILALTFAPPESHAAKIAVQFAAAPFKIMEEMFRQATEDHGNMRGRHPIYAATFIGMLNNYITLYLIGQIKLDDATRYRALHQFMHGIFS